MHTWEKPQGASDSLACLAESEARARPVHGRAGVWSVKHKAVRDLNLIMRAARDFSAWAGGKNHFVPQAFEWLLDNRYLLERETREALHALRHAGSLPKNRRTGKPVLFALADIFTQTTDGVVTAAQMALFLENVQKVRALSERELSLFVPALKLSLCAHAARCCKQMRHIWRAYRQKNAGTDNPFAAERQALYAREQGLEVPEALEALAQKAVPVHTRLAQSMDHICTSLRMLSAADVSELLQNASAVEHTLAQDPSGVYTQMEERSRAFYRYTLSRLAYKTGLSELDAARKVLALAKQGGHAPHNHVGYYILNRPLGRQPSDKGGKLYFTALFLLSLFFPVSVWLLTRGWPEALLVLWPGLELSKNLLDFFTIRIARPRHLPRMELAGGLPAKGSCLCVISVLLTAPEKAASFASQLEQYALANRDAGSHLRFGLLADLPDAPVKSTEQDQALVDAAAGVIAKLNKRYGGGFYLFFRERTLNRRDNLFMGWERKRGALLELSRFLRKKPSGIQVLAGDPAFLTDIRYLITLDADTRPTGGSIRELVGTMLHPLMTPVIDAKRRVVIHGHGLLQPRMAVSLSAAGATLFSRIYAGQGGFDPYNGVVSDVYQDVFGQGIFTGKGILDIDAYLTCLDGRLPENRILSHDLLEGSYLRAGFIGDVEWSDGYPGRVSSWFARQHRWIRGDWQILSFVSERVLPGLCRYQIWDNTRRSLTPFFLLLALGVGLWSGGALYWASSLLAVICALSQLLLSAADLAARGGAGGGARYHSTIITGLRGSFLQTFLQLLFLPVQAFSSLHAIFTALYRMLISKRYLLRWVTADQRAGPAADVRFAGTGDAGSAADVRFAGTREAASSLLFWCPGVLWGLGCMLFGAGFLSYFAGGLWVLSPLFAAKMSFVVDKIPRLKDADRAFLMRQANLIWQFFEDFLTPEDHFLPPDNWQEQPAAGLAHRTSPTNIGLGLLCVLAAHDLGFISLEKAQRLLDRMLSTIEKLPKWKGHIYNWYDTRTLAPLHPRCVSTVDSGNLAGFLLTLYAGLEEQNDAVSEDLASRVNTLLENMVFEPLYDHKRRLFYIGYDLEQDAPTDGYYDLLASEARQTSYFAIARGEIPRRHWKKLGRSLAAQDRYRGMASWTGTMFEYFMPHLIMPLYENSLLYESAKFALYCQKKRGEQTGTPWGASESCFYAFDAALNYQYKAHGIPRLALKRGMGKEWVASPYAAFLTLPLDPRGSVKNLRRFKALGLEGRYGFMEAIDFTPSRQTSRHLTAQGKRIKCFMSHHLGMSLVAADNALHDNVFVKRFMRDPAMAAFDELLMEKVPVGIKPLKKSGAEVPEKPPRSALSGLRRESLCDNSFRPACHLLTNTSYTLLCTDTGLSASCCGGLALTRFDARPHGGAGGMSFLVQEAGKPVFSLTPAPFFDTGDVTYRCHMDGGRVCWEMRRDDGLESAVTVRIPDNENAELRSVTLKNTAKTPRSFTLLCAFEPVLAPMADYRAHPAFSRLFLESEIDGQVLLIKRRARSPRREAHSFIAIAYAGEGAAEYVGEGATAYAGEGATAYAGEGAAKYAGGGERGVQGAQIKVPVTLQAGQSLSIRYALAMADTRKDAQAAAVRTLKTPVDNGPGRIDGLIRALGLTPAEAEEALSLLPPLVFITPEHRRTAAQKTANTLGVRELWRFGISGDLPILLYAEASQPEKLRRLVRQHRFLHLGGFLCDLVILTKDGGNYRRPARSAVLDVLKAMGGEASLSAQGGVHLIETASLSAEHERLLYAYANAVLGEDNDPPRRCPPPKPLSHALPPNQAAPPLSYGYNDEDNSFRFTGTPPVVWSHVLANNSFGALVYHTGPGHMWRKNARENKMTAWENDPHTLPGRETLCLCMDGRDISLFSGNDGYACTVTYGFGFAVWQKQIGPVTSTVTAFVPPRRNARVLIIELTNAPSDAVLRHYTELILGVNETARRHVVTERAGGTLLARSSLDPAYNPQVFMETSWPPFAQATGDRAAWAAGITPEKSFGAGFDPCFGIVLTPESHGELARAVIVTGTAENTPGLHLLEPLAFFPEAQAALTETKAYWHNLVFFDLHCEDENIRRYMNGWALYQVIACRMFARASLYQCGGAYGFRDQLQDACAALYANPALTRTQIIRACFHQFEEGDVQHWWHPARLEPGLGDKGVRTRISDDLLFLPYAVRLYIEKTGDSSILDIKVPFLRSEPLQAHEHDRFEQPRTGRKASVYEHCITALTCVFNRGKGEHGLPLIGGGDWNDGFDQVGPKGRGESVWLGWFAAHVFDGFAEVIEAREGKDAAAFYREHARAFAAAADNAWDGAWYWRASYDDGTLLGSAANEECRIDSIAQSFSFFPPGGTDAKRNKALDSALSMLVDEKNRLIKLFDPPFDKSAQNPGYIKGYLPGVRENGGQYTHAAIWLAQACFLAGRRKDGERLLSLLAPGGRDASVYKVEPHVLAADVYAHPDKWGQGGWTHYTGAAAWYFRVAYEAFGAPEKKDSRKEESIV